MPSKLGTETKTNKKAFSITAWRQMVSQWKTKELTVTIIHWNFRWIEDLPIEGKTVLL